RPSALNPPNRLSNCKSSGRDNVRVDAGFAGLGISKYSAQSTERRQLGLDTNDSTFDFIKIDRPTPGWSHAE
ncbi:MAG: hypothetical protein R6U43_12095, partial [Candidatus Krumholzibacteriales bacterium]